MEVSQTVIFELNNDYHHAVCQIETKKNVFSPTLSFNRKDVLERIAARRKIHTKCR